MRTARTSCLHHTFLRQSLLVSSWLRPWGRSANAPDGLVPPSNPRPVSLHTASAWTKGLTCRVFLQANIEGQFIRGRPRGGQATQILKDTESVAVTKRSQPQVGLWYAARCQSISAVSAFPFNYGSFCAEPGFSPWGRTVTTPSIRQEWGPQGHEVFLPLISLVTREDT